MKELLEGRTRLLIPRPPDKKKPLVFFNPRMKLNRDLCVLMVRGLMEKGEITFLDLLAGTGAKGLRVAKEAGCLVTLNDASKAAFDLIKKNADLNHVKVEVCNKGANLLLQERLGFNFIDIDPFGTPVPFLDNALLALRSRGYLGVTATDTAPLCGVYPEACLRKYWAVSLKTDFCHEVGIRILAGYAARAAAKYGKGLRFLLAHYREHYFRVYFGVTKGRKKADKSLAEMGYLYYCRRCLDRRFIKEVLPRMGRCRCGEEYEVAGPLWLGELMDKKLIERLTEMAVAMEDGEALRALLALQGELEVPFYYDLHSLCRSLKVQVPSTQNVLEELESMGYRASRTHFAPTAVKTDADAAVLKGLLSTSCL
jgi:tRNA (guanine26-N2/guanine27-N2)-dimethyltransferase